MCCHILYLITARFIGIKKSGLVPATPRRWPSRPSQHQPFGCISPENQPENQVLHYPGYHFVLDLVLACQHILSNSENEINSIMNIFQFLKSTNATNDCSAESLRTVMPVDSLKNLAARCSQAEENIGVTHFVFVLNAIQLRCKVIRYIFPIFNLL